MELTAVGPWSYQRNIDMTENGIAVDFFVSQGRCDIVSEKPVQVVPHASRIVGGSFGDQDFAGRAV
jgi:hypothetical protein